MQKYSVTNNSKENKGRPGMKITGLLFYMYLLMMIMVKGLGYLDDTNTYRAALLLGCVFVIAKLFIEEHSKIELYIIIPSLIVALLCWRLGGNQGVLISIFIVLAMKNIDKTKAYKFTSLCWIVFFVFQVVTQLLWLRERDFVIHSKLGIGYVIRWALGYSHPNALQVVYMIIVISVFAGFRPKGKKLIKWLFVASLGAFYIFLYSVSITGMIFYAAFVIFALYFGFRNSIPFAVTKFEKVLIQMVFPIAVIVSVAGPLLLKGRVYEVVNQALNTRLSLSKYFMTNYSQSLFGQEFLGLYHTYTLDCSYVNLLMQGGLIAFCMFMILYLFGINRLVDAFASGDESAPLELAGVLSIVVAGMAEPFMFNNSFKNVSLIVIGFYLWKYIQDKRIEKANNNESVVRKRIKEESGKDIIIYTSEPQIDAINKEINDYEWKGFDRYIEVPHMNLELPRKKMRIAYEDFESRIHIFSFIIAAIAAVIFAFNVHMPSLVVARQWMCSAEDHESLFYSEEEIKVMEDDPDIWVLNYLNEEDPMQAFDGEIITTEYYREIISVFVWVYLISMLIITILYTKTVTDSVLEDPDVRYKRMKEEMYEKSRLY